MLEKAKYPPVALANGVAKDVFDDITRATSQGTSIVAQRILTNDGPSKVYYAIGRDCVAPLANIVNPPDIGDWNGSIASGGSVTLYTLQRVSAVASGGAANIGRTQIEIDDLAQPSGQLTQNINP